MHTSRSPYILDIMRAFALVRRNANASDAEFELGRSRGSGRRGRSPRGYYDDREREYYDRERGLGGRREEVREEVYRALRLLWDEALERRYQERRERNAREEFEDDYY